MTNGQKIKEIFPNVQTDEADGHALVNFIIVEEKRVIMSACGAREEWWNAEYTESEAEND